MGLPIRALPIVERWDCHGCGICCRGTIIELTADDLKRLRGQRWADHADYRGGKVVERHGLWKPRYTLAKRPDGSCIFLTPEGRCRIHAEHGLEAKPIICQMFPLQVVPVDQFAYITLRRFCPSAAADRGRTVEEHRDAARDLIERWQEAPRASRPPALVAGRASSWKEVLTVTDALGRLVCDPRFPLIRRLIHGLEFCNLLVQCRLDNLEGSKLLELAGIFEKSAAKEAGHLFQNRQPPGPRAMSLFRQTAFEYLRLHPQFQADASWRGRWRLVSEAARFARAAGGVPRCGLPFPETTFEALERPRGAPSEAVWKPIEAFFQTAVVSLRFAVLGRPRWSVVDSFRALVLAHPVAMWVLRWGCGERAPEADDAIRLVAMLDRGQTYASLAGARHRFRVSALAPRDELARLAAWYAR